MFIASVYAGQQFPDKSGEPYGNKPKVVRVSDLMNWLDRIIPKEIFIGMDV